MMCAIRSLQICSSLEPAIYVVTFPLHESGVIDPYFYITAS